LTENKINALFVATMAMGLTAALMAWIIFVLAMKGWAEMREERHNMETAASA